jgi:hypothetical protein
VVPQINTEDLERTLEEGDRAVWVCARPPSGDRLCEFMRPPYIPASCTALDDRAQIDRQPGQTEYA